MSYVEPELTRPIVVSFTPSERRRVAHYVHLDVPNDSRQWTEQIIINARPVYTTEPVLGLLLLHEIDTATNVPHYSHLVWGVFNPESGEVEDAAEVAGGCPVRFLGVTDKDAARNDPHGDAAAVESLRESGIKSVRRLARLAEKRAAQGGTAA